MKTAQLVVAARVPAPAPTCRYLGDCPYYRERRHSAEPTAVEMTQAYCLDAERSRLCMRHRIRAKYGVQLEPTVAPA